MRQALMLRHTALVAGLLVALALALFWALGGLEHLHRWAEAGARQVQRDLAGSVRAIAAGHGGAWAGLLTVCLAYGFFHAAGPGHGKMLIGAYGVARRVPMGRLAGLAVLSSLAQSTVAVVLVYAFILGLGWARQQIEGVADAVLLPLSHAAVLFIGAWLVLRGWRGLRRADGHGDGQGGHDGAPALSHHGHPAPHHHHGDGCGHGCGHSHGPTIEQAAGITSWREAVVLVAGVALRPCTGALFLLIVSWQMGIAAAGIAGVYAMGLGTALVTLSVAALAVWAREGTIASLPRGFARAIPVIELAAGALVMVVAAQMLIAAM